MPDRDFDPDQPRFFGRRRGKKLRVTAQALVDNLLPRLAFSLPEAGQGIDPNSLFSDQKREIWLEIGFGGGEHLAFQAARNRDIGFIGAEVFLNGIASLLGHLDRDGSDNVRIYDEDVRQLLPLLSEGSLSRVFLLFPDPWPKSRHEDRRFVHDRNLDLLHRVMRKGAILRVASDDPTYQEWAQGVMAKRKDFRDVTANRLEKPEDWPATRYEMKARKAGRIPMFFSYEAV